MLRTAAKYSNADLNGGSSAGLVALVLVMVEPVAQPPKCVPGHLVGGPGCRSPCERDPAVPEDDHRDTRVNVERGRERAAGTAGVVERDAADAVADAPDVEGAVDVARLDRAAVRVVNTSACLSPQIQVCGQSAVRAWSWLRLAIRSAVTQIGGSGSVSVLPLTPEPLPTQRA